MSNLEVYRTNARSWLASMAGKFGHEARHGLSHEDDLALGREYMRARHDAGFSGINWPVEFGGQGLGHIEKVIFETEEMKFGMPVGYFGISLGMPVPILMRYGLDEKWRASAVG